MCVRSAPFILAPTESFGRPPAKPCGPTAHADWKFSFPWSY